MTEEIEEVESEEAVPTKSQEKKYTDSDLNKLLAKERREWNSKLANLQKEYDSFREDIEAKETKLQEKNREKVETLKKDMPESITKLLEKLTVEEQLEFLEKEAPNLSVEKKKIPATPEGREKNSKPVQSPLSINIR